MLTLLLFTLTIGLAHSQTVESPGTGGYGVGSHILNDDLRMSAQGHYPGSSLGGSPFAPAGTNFDPVLNTARRQAEQSAAYQEIAEKQRLRAAQEEAVRAREAMCCIQ
ncbi:MAG TPA: hypothetical protein VN872_01590, partial [Candidatus Acidoferrum sp.]|nr:hypothetical protein [Candidatus Acidoferrum sp.]